MRGLFKALMLAGVFSAEAGAAEKNVIKASSSPGHMVIGSTEEVVCKVRAERRPTLEPEPDGACTSDYVKLEAAPLCVLAPKQWGEISQDALAVVYYEAIKRKKAMEAVFGVDWNLVWEEKQQQAWAKAVQWAVDAQRAVEMERTRATGMPAP